MGIFTKRHKFKDQDFYALKKKAQDAGVLFTDPEFPAVDTSISPAGNAPGGIEWKRPHDICEKPRLFVDGVSVGDVCQGQLGNCWFVSACSVLAGVKVLWNKVIPEYDSQEFEEDNPNNYAGIFLFKFWRFGDWQEVVVDDLLPTVNGQLIYVHSQERGEFWSALLEKAYAKINNSYEALDGGNLCDALVDFTSGISATIEIADGGYRGDEAKTNELFKSLKHEIEDHALMCAAVAARSKDEMEAKMESGLVKGHAYGITAIKKVPIGASSLMNYFTGREKIYMVRLRNPWGQKEWTGAFSDGEHEELRLDPDDLSRVNYYATQPSTFSAPLPPVEKRALPTLDDLEPRRNGRHFPGSTRSSTPLTSTPPAGPTAAGSEHHHWLVDKLLTIAAVRESARSPEWSQISDAEREKLGLTFNDDGEFWMTFDDFVENFTDVSVCQLINTSFFTFTKTWNEDRRFGNWEPHVTGRTVDRAGGCLNNRETFLNNPQFRFTVEEEVEEIIIQLTQEDRRHLKTEGVTNLCIGFHIMKVEDNRRYRLHRIQEKASTSDYVRSRSVFWRERLMRGRYVLVPSTFSPGEAGRFLLRVFMDTDPQLKELVKDYPSPTSCLPCIHPPSCVVSVKVVSAEGLEKQESGGSADSYVIVKCGKESVRSAIVKQSLNPIWNQKAIFYRRPEQPIIVEVWNKGMLTDKSLGQAKLTADESPGNVMQYELPLFGHTKEDATERRPGKLTVEAVAANDMAAV